mgnify:CR=1 FL=1
MTLDGATHPSLPPTTDVVVVGGGLAGTGVAWHLARAGRAVTLLERHDLNTEASGSNSGSIHAQIPAEPFATYGEAWTRTFAPTIRLLAHSITLWRDLGAELGSDLEVDTPGGLIVAATEADMAGLAAKAAVERAHGLEVHLLDRASLHAMAPYVAPRMIGGAFCPVEGKANPLRATPALAAAARAAGAVIATHTRLDAIEVLPSGGFRVATSRGTITCRQLVNCAGAEAGTIARMVGLDLPIEAHPIQSSVTEPTAPLVKHLLYAAGVALSLKQTRLGHVLIGGGWPARLDRHSGRPVTNMASLVGNMRVALSVVPAIGALQVVRSWAAIVNGTADWKPLLGEAPRVPGFFLAFFPWMGFSAGPAVAASVAALVLGRDPGIDLGPFLISGR